MRKVDFVNRFAEVRGTTKKEAGEIVDAFLDVLKEGIKEDGEVDFFGFIKFTKDYRDATVKKSPRTGEPVEVPAKYVPKAKFSTAFKREINE